MAANKSGTKVVKKKSIGSGVKPPPPGFGRTAKEVREEKEREQAEAEATGNDLDGYASDIMDALTFETAAMSPRPWQYSYELKRGDSSSTFYWNRAGIGVYGQYMNALIGQDMATAAPLMLFLRLIDPETGQRIFTTDAHLERLREGGMSEFVLDVAGEMLKRDNEAEQLFQQKVDAFEGNSEAAAGS